MKDTMVKGDFLLIGSKLTKFSQTKYTYKFYIKDRNNVQKWISLLRENSISSPKLFFSVPLEKFSSIHYVKDSLPFIFTQSLKFLRKSNSLPIKSSF